MLFFDLRLLIVRLEKYVDSETSLFKVRRPRDAFFELAGLLMAYHFA